MNENYFMGLDGFVWFTGVVESRNDPAKLGRVQVRCLGYHTEDLTDIPTADLPWAHIMMPVTDPSMQGMGNSPSFLVEGTWVVGFFRDAKEKQQPIIMGSLPGVPADAADSSKGFNDPNGKYPGTISHSGHTTGESDVSRLARGSDAETHTSLVKRRGLKIKDVPKATKPNLDPISTTLKTDDTPTFFGEPDPRGVSTTGTSTGQYPFNHVHESESGHIQEVDDTPGGERLQRQHKSGTYEEIVADGTKTVKVIGSNYELIAGESNIFVNGDINLTTNGNKREYIAKDYILEVGGNFTRKIHKNEQVKIGVSGVGNLEEMILGNHAYNVANSYIGSVGTTEAATTSKDYILSVVGNSVTTIGGEGLITTTEDLTIHSNLNLTVIAQDKFGVVTMDGNISLASGNSVSLKSVTTMNIKSDNTLALLSTEAMSIKSDKSVALESISTMDIVGGEISTLTFATSGSTVTAATIELTGHTHTDTPGLAAAITTPPNA